MPYLPEHLKHSIDNGDLDPENAGDLNYKIHTIIGKYVKDNGESYSTYNEIIGALECVKMELYRRGTAKYEDKKRGENGDIAFYHNLSSENWTFRKV